MQRFKKVVSRALALRQSESRNRGLCIVHQYRGWSGRERGNLKNRNKLFEWKDFADTVGIEGADLED